MADRAFVASNNKHRGKLFSVVRNKHPRYLTWVKSLRSNGERLMGDLADFVTFCDERDELDEMNALVAMAEAVEKRQRVHGLMHAPMGMPLVMATHDPDTGVLNTKRRCARLYW